ARAAGVRRDGEGLRHAPGSAEVREGQGQQDPRDLPDLPEQDDRRALGAAAGRARQAPSPLTAGRSGRAVRVAAMPPRVFVITGPSGVGKGTLIRSLRERHPELELSVSATTRGPRTGEVDGVDYHFLDSE